MKNMSKNATMTVRVSALLRRRKYADGRGSDDENKINGSFLALRLSVRSLASASPLHAADVTFERLLNPEPHNWLMNHRDFGAQRYSPLDAINKSTSRA